MPALFVMHDEDQDLAPVATYKGDELVILVVIDKNKLATRFEDAIRRFEARAEGIAASVRGRGVACRTLYEWGDVVESVSNTLAREDAVLLNKSALEGRLG